MIWSLPFHTLCKKTTAIFLHNRIHTSTVLFVRGRIPRATAYQPEVKHREKILGTDGEFPEELKNECDLDDDFDFFKADQAYDLHVREQRKYKIRIQQKIVAKKFFAPRPQPLMLTWHERQCIKHLHNEDPVQWNIKSLSESFPATPDTIKKIIKSKKKISPERAKKLDLIAQKNWELLAEEKLDADPHVLEHLKRFINRREVLLEQINNTDFYLPEIKKEYVWNQGEMNKILMRYEEALSKLAAETQQNQNLKALSDHICEEKNIENNGKSNLDLIHEKFEMKCSKEPELKESFMFGRMISAFKNNVTLEELENRIMEKSEAKEKLDLIEKAVLDSKLGINSSKNFRNVSKNSNHKEYKSSIPKNAEKEHNSLTPSPMKSLKLKNKIFMENDMEHLYERTETPKVKPDELISLDNRTRFIDETEIGNLLNADVSSKETYITEKKPKIDFSDPVRLQKEKIYYDQQVSDIKNTAFWNNSRRNLEKAIAESNKQPVGGPAHFNNEVNISRTAVLSNDIYPNRIKIPKNYQGSGLTFRIKDCYYDDDGEFLYRVPGMIK